MINTRSLKLYFGFHGRHFTVIGNGDGSKELQFRIGGHNYVIRRHGGVQVFCLSPILAGRCRHPISFPKKPFYIYYNGSYFPVYSRTIKSLEL